MLHTKYLKLHFKSILQYKMSFLLSFISQIFIFFSYYFVIIALFDKFDNIKGYTKYEILLAFSIIQFGFSMVETFARGIDNFESLIISGFFDRILLRPRSIILQSMFNNTDYIKISRIIQSIIILIISLINIDINWNIHRIICILLMSISSIILFLGIFILAASYCFITLKGLETKNLITDGGKYMSQYPINIYKKGFVFIFTYIIPYAFINYYPLLYFIGKNNNILYAYSPLLVVLFLIPSILLFKLGVKKYGSTGS